MKPQQPRPLRHFRHFRQFRQARRAGLVALVALVGLLAAAGPASAADERSAWAPGKVFVQAGMAEAARSTVVGLGWTPFWDHAFAGGRAQVSLEASFGRWVGERDASHPRTQWIGQAGITPVLRWQPADPDHRWFLEAGIGANVVSPSYRRHSKRFSTAFNFGDHIGAGWRFGDHGEHELAFRLQHFSNAGIKLPNPGENFRQVRYTYAL